jgi:hypothetical protein
LIGPLDLDLVWLVDSAIALAGNAQS